MRALVITKMIMSGDDRGQPDVVDGDQLSFGHIGNTAWPADYMPFIVTGTGPQLAALSSDANFLAGQEIRYVDDALINEQLAENFTLGQFNAFIVARNRDAVTATNPIGEATAQDMTEVEAIEWWLLGEGYSQSDADSLLVAMNALLPTPLTGADAFQQIMLAWGHTQEDLDPITPVLTNVRAALDWWLSNEGYSQEQIDVIVGNIFALMNPVMTKEQAVRLVLADEGYAEEDIDAAVVSMWQRAQPIKALMNSWLEENDFDALPDVGDGYTQNWRDAQHKAIAPGALGTINTWLTNHGYDPMTADNSVLDLVQVFVPGYSLGSDNVHDSAA